MSTYWIATQGCKTNIADSMGLRARLEEEGYRAATGFADADLIVLNTCSVTGRADGDARQLANRFRRGNAGARLVVTGCLAERSPESVAAWPGVDAVLPNRRKAQLLPLLAGDDIDGGDGTLWDAPRSYPQFRDSGYTRAFVKVQDGCDANCSFCIIPVTRGASRSLDPERVVATVRDLGASGAQEVVLTGIHLGHYGRDIGTDLVALLERLGRLDRPQRLRLSSVEPNEVTAALVDRMADGESFAPHMHLPLQSGSDRILAAMRRPYNARQYAAAVEKVHARLPHAGIGADVIVGFPGEQEEDFRATRALVESLPLSYLHVFSYSPRAGTDAEVLPGRIPSEVIKDRSRALRELATELQSGFVERRAGEREMALTLSRRDGGVEALSGSFLKLWIEEPLRENRMLPVRIEGRRGERVLAVPLAA